MFKTLRIASQFTRLYSTVQATASAEPAVQAVRNTVKGAATRKTYLVDRYASLLKKSPIVLVCHNNTLLKAENATLRAQISKAGGKLTVTRSNLVKVALRGIEHEDPASFEAQKSSKGRPEHPLSKLFYGPTAVISFPELTPKAVEDVVKIIDKTNERLILLGGQVDKSVLSRADIDHFKTLPSLEQVRAELAGVLSILGGAGLVQTLQASTNMLYLTMDEHRKQLDPESKSD
ncbi:large ribosomal subunit protein uL10m [Trichomonascus vanleenenianus]|uniref:mitochondrial 54S ribosomal protein uL10m MRPL11 n=1 Tax=Trichomonascus vanleenenianus TaxID=2268995 RepID=UPI003ECAA4A0